MEEVDCIVVGAGVVGLAIAAELARRGREVIVLEKESLIGSGVSSRNSEVIHAGLYYPAETLKAQLCVEGKARLYALCEQAGIAHRRCGKLIVAETDNELSRLEAIKAQGEANGVEDLDLIDRDQMARLGPALKGAGALISPSTGIVDSHGLMLSYQGVLEDHGGMIAFNAPVRSGAVTAGGIRLDIAGEAAMTLCARSVVNAAALGAQALSRAIEGVAGDSIPPQFLAKGNYFALSGRAPFSRLIYPVPEPGGLGIHLTLDLGGQAKFGPDVEWLEAEDYRVSEDRRAAFEHAVRRYYPDLAEGALHPAYTGIRPKIEKPGGSSTDFLIHDESAHGVAGYVALYGIESPGLTASPALARHVADRVEA